MLKVTSAGAIVLTLALAGCGQNLGQQAVLGGGTGAVVAAATGGDPLTGAAVGAAGNVAFCQLYPAQCY